MWLRETVHIKAARKQWVERSRQHWGTSSSFQVPGAWYRPIHTLGWLQSSSHTAFMSHGETLLGTQESVLLTCHLSTHSTWPWQMVRINRGRCQSWVSGISNIGGRVSWNPGWTWSYHVAETILVLLNLLPLPGRRWCYRWVLPTSSQNLYFKSWIEGLGSCKKCQHGHHKKNFF